MNEELINIRNQFPILKQFINGKRLVYLDNAATSQKPKLVLKKIQYYYTRFNANVHRGIHTLSQEATNLMEETRSFIHKFINSKFQNEIIFTKGSTEGINLVAHGIQNLIHKNDEILISQLEHHSNIVPWQILAEKKQAKICVIPINTNGDLILDNLDLLITEKTKIIAISAISNALGTINPVEIIIKAAHKKGALILIDAAQAIAHQKIDVQKWDCDFLVFSGHKMYGPTGVGILYGKKELLKYMIPYQTGGEMVKEVTLEKTTYQDIPLKFEAGTPNIEANIVLKDSINFINSIGFPIIENHESKLKNYLLEKLKELKFIKIYAKKVKKQSGVISFNMILDGITSTDVGYILDQQGIAVRTGNHCAQPIMNFFNISGTIRASFAIYNTIDDINKLINGLKKSYSMLK